MEWRIVLDAMRLGVEESVGRGDGEIIIIIKANAMCREGEVAGRRRRRSRRWKCEEENNNRC